MAAEVVGKFKKGDRVVVIAEDSWCKGCHGTISGLYPMKHQACCLVKLDDSPNPVLKSSWVYEDGLEKE